MNPVRNEQLPGSNGVNPEFEKCLKHGKIKEFSEGKSLTCKELKPAERDLEDGKEGFSRKKLLQSNFILSLRDDEVAVAISQLLSFP